jgi:Zn-dependent metalloprotease
MRIKAKTTPPATGATPRKAVSAPKAAKKVAPAAPASGLSGYSIDSSELTGKAALAALATERATRAGIAGPRARVASFSKLDAESAALAHLNDALASDAVKKFTRPKIETDDSDFKSLGAEASPLTKSTVVKFRQQFNKIPVYGSLVTVELDKGNVCIGINSSLGTPTGVKHIASVSPATALANAAKAAGVRASTLQQTPRLYYYFDQHARKWRIAYIIENVVPERPKGGAAGAKDAPLKDYVIDGHSGKLLAELPRIATMAAAVETVKDANNKTRKITVETVPGNKREMRNLALNVTTYDFNFKDPSAQGTLLPGTLYVAPPAPWSPEAIGAHANGAEVAKFLRTVLLRENIDNQGGEMISTVNCWDRREGVQPPRQWQNAYWNGEQMVYGQILFPDGTFYSVASMLDVVGHEMFHGVTDFTSRLEYVTQSGALNESYSDIFGVIIANFSRSLAKWKWDIGVGFSGPGTALRNLEDPALHDQPKHMDDFRTATPPFTYERNDYGWVHDNSGIHNFAAFKIMTAKNAGKFIFTKKEVAAMFFVALTVHLSRTSQFSDSRRAVVTAARSLFRNNSAALLARKVKAVEDGFDAVGIF